MQNPPRIPEYYSNSKSQAVLGHQPWFRNPIVPWKPQWEQLCLSMSQAIGKTCEKSSTRRTSPTGGFGRMTAKGKDCLSQNCDFQLITIIRIYEGGGFPITREGRLKFGFRARKVFLDSFFFRGYRLTVCKSSPISKIIRHKKICTLLDQCTQSSVLQCAF